MFLLFFFNETATTEIYTYGHPLSLHDALPIYRSINTSFRAANMARMAASPRAGGARCDNICIMAAPSNLMEPPLDHDAPEPRIPTNGDDLPNSRAREELSTPRPIGRASLRDMVCQ